MLPGLEMMACPEMAVSMDVMQHVINVESSRNPYAIGVVGGALVRQPKALDEALATVRMLEEKGYNFSIGLAQVNRYNLGKYGLDSYEKAFQQCPNLQAGSRILAECYKRPVVTGASRSAVTTRATSRPASVTATCRRSTTRSAAASRLPAMVSHRSTWSVGVSAAR